MPVHTYELGCQWKDSCEIWYCRTALKSVMKIQIWLIINKKKTSSALHETNVPLLLATWIGHKNILQQHAEDSMLHFHGNIFNIYIVDSNIRCKITKQNALLHFHSNNFNIYTVVRDPWSTIFILLMKYGVRLFGEPRRYKLNDTQS
jgi:hypothetical protein